MDCWGDIDPLINCFSKWLPPRSTSCMKYPMILQLSSCRQTAGKSHWNPALLTKFNIWWNYFCSLLLLSYFCWMLPSLKLQPEFSFLVNCWCVTHVMSDNLKLFAKKIPPLENRIFSRSLVVWIVSSYYEKCNVQLSQEAALTCEKNTEWDDVSWNNKSVFVFILCICRLWHARGGTYLPDCPNMLKG